MAVRKTGGLVCALLCLAVAALAVDFTALQPEGYISDFARVIDPSTRAALESYCARVEETTGAQIAVITIQTLSGEPVEDVANAIFRKWGIGKKGSDEGVLLLLATTDHKMRLEVGYGLEPIVPDGVAGGLLRAMRPALRASQYGEAVTEAVQALGSRIAEAKGKSIDVALPRRTRRSEPRADFLPALMLGGLFVLWALGAAGGRRRRGRYGGSGADMITGMIIGNLLGRSFGGRGGGGGFGGFDSGGGFGGFGGGSSGGGGASSSW